MRRSNYPLRLQPSLMEEARQAAESQGVTPNQLFNVAVAEKLSAMRTEKYFQERIRRADREETLRILDRAGKGNPPREGDELLSGEADTPVEASNARARSADFTDEQSTIQKLQPAGRAIPPIGQRKRKLHKFKNR